MCYDINYLSQKKSKYEKRYQEVDIAGLNHLFDEKGQPIQPVFHSSGFSHPLIPVITNEDAKQVQLFEWGLIPPWVKSTIDAVKLQNQTLNARAETLFEKPAFRAAAKQKRCLVVIDGFFEHQHQNGKTIPHYIKLRNGDPITLAGIWEEWNLPQEGIKKSTVSIVTTSANSLMAKIHNNPKIEGPRMPVILPAELEKKWLVTEESSIAMEELKSLLLPYDADEMEAWPVQTIRGKNVNSNRPKSLKKIDVQISLDF